MLVVKYQLIFSLCLVGFFSISISSAHASFNELDISEEDGEIVGTYKDTDFLLAKQYFCSDLCPDYGRIDIVIQYYSGGELVNISKSMCEELGEEILIDPAWRGYIGCAPNKFDGPNFCDPHGHDIRVLPVVKNFGEGDILIVSVCLSEPAFAKGVNIHVFDSQNNLVDFAVRVPDGARTVNVSFPIDEDYQLNGTFNVQVDAAGNFVTTKPVTIHESKSMTNLEDELLPGKKEELVLEKYGHKIPITIGNGAKVEGLEINSQKNSITISLMPKKGGGKLLIMLPRTLIDAQTQNTESNLAQDIDFKVFSSNLLCSKKLLPFTPDGTIPHTEYSVNNDSRILLIPYSVCNLESRTTGTPHSFSTTIISTTIEIQGTFVNSQYDSNEIPLTPKKQTVNGVLNQEIMCKTNLELIYKSSDGSPACVKPSSVDKLMLRGWTNLLS